MLVPRRRATIEETVTVSVADLYDYLSRHTGHEEEPMPDTNAATTVKKVKRGWRRVSMNLRLAEYDLLARMAEEEERTPDQQAAFLLRQKLNEMVEAPLNGRTGDLDQVGSHLAAQQAGGQAEMEEIVIGPNE